MDSDTLEVERIVSLDPNGKYILQFKRKLSDYDKERLNLAINEWQTRQDAIFLVLDLECEVLKVKLPKVLDGH